MHQKILISLFLLMTAGSAFTQEPTLPLSRILYSSFRPEGWDVYLSVDGGKSFNPFTNDPALEYDAVITPDGKNVIFTSERTGHPQLFIQSIDGKDAPRQLIKSESMQDQAAISPDGRWMVFVSTHEGNADIYKLPFNTDSIPDLQQAINLSHHPGGDFRPSFSPDGHLIAFCSDRAQPIGPNPDFPFARHRIGNIFTMDTLGLNVQQLTHGREWEGSPKWSPDGTRIFYYGVENRIPNIFSMNADGKDQKRITPPDTRAISPCLLQNGKIAFTAWHRGIEDSFRLFVYDTLSGQKDTLVPMQMNMLNLDAHPNGTMVFHGAPKPVRQESNRGGFSGNLLIASQPFVYHEAGLHVETYGIRRAFTAPAFPDSPYVIVDHMDIQQVTDAFSPWLFLFMLFPVIMIIFLFTGIIQGIRLRKQIAFRHFLKVSLFALLVLLVIMIVSFLLLLVARMPLHTIRLVLTCIALACVGFAFIFKRRYIRKKAEGILAYKADRLNMWTFSTGAVAAFYLAISLHLLLNIQVDFYKVNYVSGETSLLFSFKPDPNLNPSFSQFIDGRISTDAKQMMFTIGGFGASAHHQGTIWSIDLDSRQMERRADSDANDGFGDMSSDGKRMVFRSGRQGHFDLYLEDENEIIQLTRDTFKENFPSISPQGDKIVYASDKEGVKSVGGPRTFDLYLLDRKPDGAWSGPIKLTAGMSQNAHPSFSPDGEWVIYTTEEFGISDEQPLVQNFIFSPQMYGEITALRLKDMQKFRLTHNKWEEGAPQWVKGIRE